MWELDGNGVAQWSGSAPILTASTINHEVDLTTAAPIGTFRLRLTEGDRPLYADRAAWVGLGLPHEMFGSYAIADTPFGRALVRLGSRRCGMTFEFLRPARDSEAIGDDVFGASLSPSEERFYQ